MYNCDFLQIFTKKGFLKKEAFKIKIILIQGKEGRLHRLLQDYYIGKDSDKWKHIFAFVFCCAYL